MPFWTYMLHCADRSFYVGHTDDLELRMAQHARGTFGGYTAAKHPLTLVWSAEFPTRCEALAAERQVKGWGRPKKLALIRGDWMLISALARNAGEKERASTSSARTVAEEMIHPSPVRPELVEGQSFVLHPHPSTRDHLAEAITGRISRPSSGRLLIHYVVVEPTGHLLVPAWRAPERRDRLWQHTCFECFLRPGSGYLEFNLSPSTEWAAYRFTDYRGSMRPFRQREAPVIRLRKETHHLTAGAELNGLPPGTWHLNLAAVLESTSGTKSYWALSHPAEGPPDFHDPACFTLELPPPGEP